MAKNIITEQRYNKIKPHVGNPKDDSKNKKKFGIGQSVIRDIRNTTSFAEYKRRGATYRKQTKKAKLFLESYNKAKEIQALHSEQDVKKKSQIIDICVLIAIAIMIIIVLMIGGK